MTKKVFGIILTSLGIIAMIYAAFSYFGQTNVARLDSWVPFVLGIIFFVSGISIISNLDSDRTVREREIREHERRD